MSWAKASAAVGLGGLTEKGAALGALFTPEFQNMPDPLAVSEVRSSIMFVVIIYRFNCN